LDERQEVTLAEYVELGRDVGVTRTAEESDGAFIARVQEKMAEFF
jgi:hypothetical protein